MTDLPAAIFQTMSQTGFECALIQGHSANAIIFESKTVIGFSFCYASSADLLRNWTTDLDRVIGSHQLVLRRAGEKAWNTYAVFLAAGACTSSERIAFSAIEEDLIGTRKIARGEIDTVTDVEAALLPLRSLQTSPRLDAVDIKMEIAQRSTELSEISLKAFFSNAKISDVLQILEDE